ncbi:MAG: YHS domain-containing protein [Dehalococcoidia bacterium]|nr:YHS domain-containing protein [Dehalococcoidia bacterium]
MGWISKLLGGQQHEESTGTGSGMHMASHSASSTKTAKDPVCGMDVDVDRAAATATFEGQSYYFCAPGCKKAFDQDPAKYLRGKGETNGGHMH